jgi:hypothetical protein
LVASSYFMTSHNTPEAMRLLCALLPHNKLTPAPVLAAQWATSLAAWEQLHDACRHPPLQLLQQLAAMAQRQLQRHGGGDKLAGASPAHLARLAGSLVRLAPAAEDAGGQRAAAASAVELIGKRHAARGVSCRSGGVWQLPATVASVADMCTALLPLSHVIRGWAAES